MNGKGDGREWKRSSKGMFRIRNGMERNGLERRRQATGTVRVSIGRRNENGTKWEREREWYGMEWSGWAKVSNGNGQERKGL